MSRKQKKQAASAATSQLRVWQERLQDSDRVWSGEVAKMDAREKLFAGDRTLKPVVKGDKRDLTSPHRRNIIFENIESQVSSSIPQPKVTPKREKDEKLAHLIENFIRNELDRMKFEEMNDQDERTVPIQGGSLWHIEWDNTKRSHIAVGVAQVSLLHPKQLAPQPGVYAGVESMDWVILKIPTTKETIRRKYGVSVSEEGESEPDIRSTGSEDDSKDAVTQYIGYARNENGGIDRYSWVNDIELENLKDYQARRLPSCSRCGRIRPMRGQVICNNVAGMVPGLPGQAEQIRSEVHAGRLLANTLADSLMLPQAAEEGFLSGVPMGAEPDPAVTYDGGACPWCGSNEWTQQEQAFENIVLPLKTAMGNEIPGEHLSVDELGNAMMVPTKVPFYRPDIYPLVLRKSVSMYGQLLGSSDVDMIEDQQNTTNRLEKKILDRLMGAGSLITLPPKAHIVVDPEDNKKLYLQNPSDKAFIDTFDFKGNLQYEMAYLNQVYEESRQILGITDSFQGRKDPTATSGKAKEYSAAMAAGRLESKRVMKNAAYATLFELIFKFYLAYADEPRPVTYRNSQGQMVYAEFNRYDFLEQDEDGNWHWNDQFLFSCDTSAPLANNREAMWQETRMNLQTGAFGDPGSTETLILFWSKMEMLHYPGAGETKSFLEEKLKREQAQAQQMAAMQMAQPEAAPQSAGEIPQTEIFR